MPRSESHSYVSDLTMKFGCFFDYFGPENRKIGPPHAEMAGKILQTRCGHVSKCWSAWTDTLRDEAASVRVCQGEIDFP
jgi:hypothetical protein